MKITVNKPQPNSVVSAQWRPQAEQPWLFPNMTLVSRTEVKARTLIGQIYQARFQNKKISKVEKSFPEEISKHCGLVATAKVSTKRKEMGTLSKPKQTCT